MSLLITTVKNGSVQMLADTRVTSSSGGFQTLVDGKIWRTSTTGREVLIGTVGSADHHSLIKYAMMNNLLKGDSWQDIFNFITLVYDQADDRGMQVFSASSGAESVFHIAFPNKAWIVEGLSIEPIREFAASGTGADIAFGAWNAGATPFHAASIACKHNVFCSFPIDVWSVDRESDLFYHVRFDENGNEIIEPD